MTKLADEESGKIIDADRCAGTLPGFTRAEILGHKASQFPALDTVLAAGFGSNSTSFECDMVRANGTALAVSVRATHLKLYGRTLVLRLRHELRK